MRMQQFRFFIWLSLLLTLVFLNFYNPTYAQQPLEMNEYGTIDRISLANKQIDLLDKRLSQVKQELADLQREHDKPFSAALLAKLNKRFLDKYSLDKVVSRSNLESINVELLDAQQMASWLEKNIQEIENQLNVLGMFGSKHIDNGIGSSIEMRSDLTYQRKLLLLEKKRIDYLQELQTAAKTILQLKQENYTRLNNILKSRNMLHIKQQQVKDELIYQEKQNAWQQELNKLYTQLASVDAIQSRDVYLQLERDIFYANENANYAYALSLIARYTDQVQQMKLMVLRSSSMHLLNETLDQVQQLTKQVDRLESSIKSRIATLRNHITYLSPRKLENIQPYLDKLAEMETKYKSTDKVLASLKASLQDFRTTLEQELQNELSSRQGFPTFSFKTILDIGKEILLVPALTFQVTKSLSSYLMRGFESTSALAWILLLLTEIIYITSLSFLYRHLQYLSAKPTSWRETINFRWIFLQCVRRSFFDIVVILNVIGIFYFFNAPFQIYDVVIYLAIVWLIFKNILTVFRICLVETTHDTTGRDMKLYRRMCSIILCGGVITGVTVFVHQLPLIFELKTLCDRFFLFFVMVGSLLLLRNWEVVPNLILSHGESRHPYIEKTIRLLGFLIPFLLFCNSLIGLFGFLNLVLIVSRYEGIFLIVLIAYLILRGLLADGMEQLSRLVIQYVNNGWLWTEAFLKPIHKLLRITLFLTAWLVLFVLYGWDKQSPVIERFVRLLNYKLISVLNTSITPLSVIKLILVISIFYWTAKWTREFVYRLLASRTKDMGIRNSIAILSQYSVVVVGAFFCLRVLGIDLQALAFVASMFAFGVGLGLRDLANNFACGFLILLERPLRVGDIVDVNGVEGEVSQIGGRAVTVRTWDHMELSVPNAEIFNKPFTNWTAKDNVVRTVLHINISRHDNPHEIRVLIQNILSANKDVLKEPSPEVFVSSMSESLLDFEIRYCVNIRQVKSRTSVRSTVLMSIWDAFAQHGIKPPHPQREIIVRSDKTNVRPVELLEQPATKKIDEQKRDDNHK